MALWGGRFEFKQSSVTREDFGEPGEGLRDAIPLYPPGVFVGKFGERHDESTTVADFQPKERVSNELIARSDHLKQPRQLKKEWWEDEQFPIDDLQPLYRASSQRYDETARRGDKHSGEYVGVESSGQWPVPDPPVWRNPGPRRPYFHFNTLRTDGQFERLTTTYAEHMGSVRPTTPQGVKVPPPGLLPWGVPQRETEYLKEYSGEMLRHPQYQSPTPRCRHAMQSETPPRWETTYEAACNQVENAPSWLKDFLAKPYPKRTLSGR
ncbi:uncharacterized protein LOC135934157 [Cloeon dipterum]|uniref:uncharacterized protein LOC135934157 n=1 Tax=Cloeon dipterum TaxID=197152 RepID=UPI0032202EDE